MYNYKEIKKIYEEKKLFLNQYEKNIVELENKIVELRYDYDLLKSESISDQIPSKVAFTFFGSV